MAGGSSVRVVIAAFACNGVIAVSKFVAASITASALTHHLVDVMMGKLPLLTPELPGVRLPEGLLAEGLIAIMRLTVSGLPRNAEGLTE